jgi:hypothetical protein
MLHAAEEDGLFRTAGALGGAGFLGVGLGAAFGAIDFGAGTGFGWLGTATLGGATFAGAPAGLGDEAPGFAGRNGCRPSTGAAAVDDDGCGFEATGADVASGVPTGVPRATGIGA